MLKLTKNKRMLVITLLLLALITPMLGGCSMFNRSTYYISDKEAEQEMLDFLYDKYGVEFISYGVRKNEPGFAQMYVNLGDPEQYWSVARKVNEDGTVEFGDNYAFELIDPYYQEEVDKIGQQYFPGAYFNVYWSASEPVPNTIKSVEDRALLEEYAKTNKYVWLNVSVYVIADNEDEIDESKVDALLEKVETIAPNGRFGIAGYTKENFHDKAPSFRAFYSYWGGAQEIRNETLNGGKD